MVNKNRSQELAIPYPTRVMKWLYKSPILLWKLGLGFVVGRLFLILTTTGRKSGEARHTAIEFHCWKGRLYVVSGWGSRAQWYKNIVADPHVTIQTAHGTQSMIARRVTDDTELAQAFGLIEANPTLRQWIKSLGVDVDKAAFLSEKERFFLITFDPTEEPTPAPLRVDLAWVWLVTFPLLLIPVLLNRRTVSR